MQVVYRASTQCDSCLTVTDTPFPGWGTERAGLDTINRMPDGWQEFKFDCPGRGYSPYSVCVDCVKLPFAKVVENIGQNWKVQTSG